MTIEKFKELSEENGKRFDIEEFYTLPFVEVDNVVELTENVKYVLDNCSDILNLKTVFRSYTGDTVLAFTEDE